MILLVMGLILLVNQLMVIDSFVKLKLYNKVMILVIYCQWILLKIN